MSESSRRWDDVKRIVADALELEEGARDAFVRDACGDDEDLLREVRSLLAPSTRTRGILETNALEVAGEPIAPTLIGPYRISRRIGEGGMGTVFEALQEHPRRTVALKVLREGFLGPAARARFDFEIEALGRLKHPAIAQIYGAGTDERTRLPYFAMELVEGIPITDFAARESLSVPARLELAARVCDGVHHAHQHGVIHRDLKPENVLVDRSGDPKILDFGIARATDVEARAEGRRTQVGQFIGTLAYMSPEQLSGDPDRVDIRTDVYALGVVLHQLLTDRLPHALEGLSLADSIRRVQETEPPSLRRWRPELDKDVETIVMIALAKEPERRYASASELAADLRRVTRHEAISMRPPSGFYLLKKLARRHRAVFSFAVLSLILLLAAVAGTTLGLARAERERGRAVAAADSVRSINRHLLSLLGHIPPEILGGQDIVRAVLDEWASAVEEGFPAHPELRAEMSEALGWTYYNLELYDEGEPWMRTAVNAFEHSLGPAHESTLRARDRMAQIAIYAGRAAENEGFSRDSLERCRASLGEDHARTLTAMATHALLLQTKGDLAESLELFRRAVEGMAVNRPHDLETLTVRNNFALALGEAGELAAAEEQYRRAYESFRNVHGEAFIERRLVTAIGLAQVLSQRGDLQQAIEIQEIIVSGGRAHWGELHSNTFTQRSVLVRLHLDAKDFAAAEREARSLLEDLRRFAGDGDPRTWSATDDLASALAGLGNYDKARPLVESVLRRREESLGKKAPATLASYNNYARLLMDLGEHAKAEEVFTELLDRCTSADIPAHYVAMFRLNHGRCLAKLERFDEARRELEAAREAFEKIPGSQVQLEKVREALESIHKPG